MNELLQLNSFNLTDIAYAVGVLSRFVAKHSHVHWVGCKRVLRYLCGTSNLGIRFAREVSSVLVAYSDADWGGDVKSRRSTTGYVVLKCSGPVSWRSRLQCTVALSSTEAELTALVEVTQETPLHLISQ